MNHIPCYINLPCRSRYDQYGPSTGQLITSKFCILQELALLAISPSGIAFLDLTIYIIDVKLCTRLYTKSIDRHMYLNFNSEHPINLQRSIPYSQFLRLQRIHYESYYLIQSQIHLYWYFIWREYPHDILLEAWMKTNQVTREALLTDTTGK